MKNNQENGIANTLYAIGWIVISLSFIFGITFASDGYDFEWSIFFIWLFAGALSGITWIGFSEIIKLLHSMNEFHNS